MPNCKKFSLLLVLTLVFLGLSGGAVLAGTESTADVISFTLTNDMAYIAGSTDTPANDTATLNFEFDFDPGVTGFVDGTYIRLVFDPSEMSFIEARPTDAWGTVGVTAAPARVWDDEPDNEDTIVYDISTSNPFEVLAGVVALAEFDFTISCQAAGQVNDVNILYAQELTYVSTTADNYVVNTPLDRIDHGSVINETYNGEFWVADTDGLKEYVGALGTHIEVPIILQSDFNVWAIDVYLAYDTDNVTFTPNDITIVGGYFASAWAIVEGPDVVRIVLVNNSIADQFNDPTEVATIGFTVINNWQGGESSFTITTDVEPPKMYVDNGDGGCFDAPDPTDHTFNGGTISIDAYAAEFVTEFTDGGTVSDHDCEVDMMIKMSNNFATEAAQYSIIANLNLGTDWGYVDNSLIEPSVNFCKNEYEGDPGADDYLGLWTEPNSGSIPIQDIAQPLVGFKLDAFFGAPDSYAYRKFPIHYSATYGTESERYARVRDMTSQVELTDGAGLTWDAPEVEYLMGRYSSPSVQAGNCDITQTYYTQNNFILDDFRVKIIVSGPHYMKDITTIAGVELESFDEVGYKWAILRTIPGTPLGQAPTADDSTAFADILYTRSGGSNLVAKETVGDNPEDPSNQFPPTGHWETRTSTVTFEYDSPGEFYMAETVDNANLEHHVVAVGGTVVSKWWTDANVNHQLFGLQLPEDFELLQNYPNPFNPNTEIAFGLPTACRVELTIYNIAGQLVETLAAGQMEAGWHTVTWDGAGYASGIYLYRLQAGEYTESQKMILLK